MIFGRGSRRTELKLTYKELYALLKKNKRLNRNERKVRESDQDIPAQEEAKKQGARFQKENEHGERPQGSEEKTPERQTQAVILRRRYLPRKLCRQADNLICGK